MSRATPATVALDRAGVAYDVVTYPYDPQAEKTALQAAEAMGAAPAQVLKTLMLKADGRPVCAVIASDREVSLKRLAAAVGAKAAEMMRPPDAERRTGYRVGGISPFGQRTPPSAFVVDKEALREDVVFVNGGQRGLEIRIAPTDLAAALGTVVAAVAA